MVAGLPGGSPPPRNNWGKISAQHSIRAGVPQYSVLGQTLFLLYVADIDKCLVSDTQLSAFADDTTVYTRAL